ncbi:MAG: hypothetical protein V7636_1844 [Actinomycetota bacterium]
MKIIPRLAVAGVAALAVYAPMAPAFAGGECAPPYCNPPVKTDQGAVLGEEASKPAVAELPAVAAKPQSAPAGELAFTGGDVLGMTVIGAGALGLGTILVRRSKAAKQTA